MTNGKNFLGISSPIQRQQTKWVLFGVLAAVALFIMLVLNVLPFPNTARGTVVQETMQPEHVSLWLRKPEK